MLTEPFQSDNDSTSVMRECDDDNLIFVDDDIQTGWNSIQYDTIAAPGILIVPPNDDASFQEEAPVLIQPDQESNNSSNGGNLSIPSTISTTLPSIEPEGNVRGLGNVSIVSGDISELRGSETESHKRVRDQIAEESEDNFFTAATDFVNRHNSRITLIMVALIAVSTCWIVVYLYQERNVWRETTIRLEETVRELQYETDGKLVAEQEKLKVREEAAIQQQLTLASKLQEELNRLKLEAEARLLEKKKADLLEEQVRLLKEEVISLDRESQLAKELEQKVIKLEAEAADREEERKRALHLEEEVIRLQNKVAASTKTLDNISSCRADNGDHQFTWEGESSESGKTTLMDNCWMQSEVKMELGECGRKARDSLSQRLKEWSESLAKAQDRVKEQMAQDYSDLKELFRANEVKEQSQQSQKSSTTTAKPSTVNETQSSTSESVNKIFKNLGETLSKTPGLVMDQMARDYYDLKQWYNDFLAGEQQMENKEHEAYPIPGKQKIKQEDKKSSTDVTKERESSQSDSLKDTAKTILKGVAFASLASVVTGAAGSWLSSSLDDENE